MRNKPNETIKTPDGYDAVGAYVWEVTINNADQKYHVLTNDPVPDADFKKIVDYHRIALSKKIGAPLDSVRVTLTELIGFAHGAAHHEKSVPANIEYADGQVLISPEFSSQVKVLADKLDAYDKKLSDKRRDALSQLETALNGDSTITTSGIVMPISRASEISRRIESRRKKPQKFTTKRPETFLFHDEKLSYEKFTHGTWQRVNFKDILAGTLFRIKATSDITQSDEVYMAINKPSLTPDNILSIHAELVKCNPSPITVSVSELK